MNTRGLAVFVTGLVLAMPTMVLSQEGQMKGMDMPMKNSPQPALQPAEGASIKILSPKEGQVFKGDEVPLRYSFAKGKRGAHLHAYVDGELMGMFSDAEKGTLTGIQPGQHALELRVVAEDHQTELDASDRVHFMVK